MKVQGGEIMDSVYVTQWTCVYQINIPMKCYLDIADWLRMGTNIKKTFPMTTFTNGSHS